MTETFFFYLTLVDFFNLIVVLMQHGCGAGKAGLVVKWVRDRLSRVLFHLLLFVVYNISMS